MELFALVEVIEWGISGAIGCVPVLLNSCLVEEFEGAPARKGHRSKKMESATTVGAGPSLRLVLGAR